MAVLLITIAVLFVIFIIVSFKNYKSKKAVNESDAISAELQNVVDMAMVDGVLTPKEEKMISEISKKYNVEVDKLINEIHTVLENSNDTPETEIINQNKRKGDDFEKFVVKILSKNKYLKIKRWTGDKYVDGIYDKTNQQPDLLIECMLKGEFSNFAIECKWRNGLGVNYVQIAKNEQLSRYRAIKEIDKIPVFIVLGVGGTPNRPDNLYVLPLQVIKNSRLYFNFL